MNCPCIMILLAFCIATTNASAAEPWPPAYRTERVDMGPGCRFEISIPFKAELPWSYDEAGDSGGGTVIVRLLPRQYVKSDLYLTLSCNPMRDFSGQGDPVRLDETTGKWSRYFPNRVEGVQALADEEDRIRLDKAIHFHSLSAENAQGYAYTEDYIIGEEYTRHRMMRYCWVHSPKVLCGEGVVGLLRAGRRGDLTQHALKILRSIQFLEEPSRP